MAIEAVAAKLGIEDELKEKLAELPGLFGDEEVFDEALKISDSEECKDAVNNLKSVYSLLKAYGFADYISIDFSMLHDIAYYSGIIFRGVTPGIGFPVVSGGRYDELISKFGEDMPATGFALGIKRVMIAMERQELLSGYYETDAVISSEPESYEVAYTYAEELRENGKRAVLFSDLTKNELLKEKENKKAKEAIFIDDNGIKNVL